MTTLIRPDNGQPAEFVSMARNHICLRTTCITPAVRWFSEAAIQAVNPLHTCAEPCRAITIWRPTVEVPIDQLGFYRPGKKSFPGLELTLSDVRIVLTMPEEKAAA